MDSSVFVAFDATNRKHEHHQLSTEHIHWDAAAASGSSFKMILIFCLSSFFTVASDAAMMQCLEMLQK
jgi:acyl dehydratase